MQPDASSGGFGDRFERNTVVGVKTAGGVIHEVGTGRNHYVHQTRRRRLVLEQLQNKVERGRGPGSELEGYNVN